MMWKSQGTWAIGGLHEIGFKPSSDILMVLSSQGRGIFDCAEARRVDRDRSDYYSEHWSFSTGIVRGFGDFVAESFICGGFEAPDLIAKTTRDGWVVEVSKKLRLYRRRRISRADVMSVRHEETNMKVEVGVFHFGIHRAYGFSETGRSFVIGTSSDITIWNRQI